MNEIITKLDEIEQKAEAILTKAQERREKIFSQIEDAKREIDAKYERMEQAAMALYFEELRSKNDAKRKEKEEKSKEEIEELARFFEERKEALAEEIFFRIIERSPEE
ncbi:MAG: hypothetical protein PUB98_03540 [Clostridiales bacterium]|nr:hypothetical protein [Clostridiales bacterium]